MRWDQCCFLCWKDADLALSIRQITPAIFGCTFARDAVIVAQHGVAVRTAPLTHRRLGRSGCRPHVALASARTSLHGAHALPAPACNYVASKARKAQMAARPNRLLGRGWPRLAAA